MYTSILLLALGSAPANLPGFGHHGCYGNSQLRHATASIKYGKFSVQSFRIEFQEVEKQITQRIKNKDGQEQDIAVTVKVLVPVSKTFTEAHEASKVRILNADGKEEPAAATRLATPTRVLTAMQGMPIDPLYLSLLKKDTLILVAPPYVDPKAPVPIRPNARLDRDFPSLTAFQQPQPDIQVKAPQTPPPTVGRATIDAEGQLHLEEKTTRTVSSTQVYDKELDGKVSKVPFQLKQTFEAINERNVHSKWIKGHDVLGKAIPSDLLITILHRPTIVLVANGNQPVDRYYLELFRDDVVTLVLPPSYGPMYGSGVIPAPAPMPAPALKKVPAPLP